MNYIGSKLSLIDFLSNTIKNVTGYTDGDNYIFADLFAGTGVVGYTFKKKDVLLFQMIFNIIVIFLTNIL